MQRFSAAALLALVSAVSTAWAADMPTKAPPAAAADVVRDAWNVQFASEARYYSWKGDRGSPPNFDTAAGSGSQWYVPVALQVTPPLTTRVSLPVWVFRPG